jgi:hypothetical protein
MTEKKRIVKNIGRLTTKYICWGRMEKKKIRKFFFIRRTQSTVTF